jgi:sugar/nucleoside kinase (ribokinase family)
LREARRTATIDGMPNLRPRRPRPPGRPRRPLRTRRAPGRLRSVVVGDLMLDVVIAPARPLEPATDVPGRIALTQGGSAATTARWLARLGARSALVAVVGRDAVGRALVDAIRSDGVTPHVVRVAGSRTGRIGVVVEADGERSFVADRGAADLIGPDDLKAAWFKGIDVLHLPVYSLIGHPLGATGRRSIELARSGGAVVSLDLASTGPLLAEGRPAALELVGAVQPDFLFTTAAEATALLGARALAALLDLAGTAVVKRGAKGATVLTRSEGGPLRFEVATTRLAAADTTGAGDAFDAGFLAGWHAARAAGHAPAAALHRGALGGHRAAARQISTPRPELSIG